MPAFVLPLFLHREPAATMTAFDVSGEKTRCDTAAKSSMKTDGRASACSTAVRAAK
jgi:hypothetical protein